MKGLATLGVLLAIAAPSAQQLPRLTFEVASVRTSTSDGTTGGVRPGPDGVTAQGASLFLLLRVAYNLPDYQIAGPDWLREARYDIVAKANGAVRDQEALRQMLQSLLADRFKLVTHREQQLRTGYALLVAGGGPRLRQVEDTGRGGTSASPGNLVFTAATMSGLTRRLSQILGEPVVDGTGLSGAYDFSLQWQQEASAVGPSLFTALPEQLGLKLESRRIPLEVLVVDRAERIPTEN